jgi:RNA polymerase sigma factor (sigma-70 family)
VRRAQDRTLPSEDGLRAALQAGDESRFGTLFERHRRELRVHCYRMLGSFEDAEDLVQETFLHAWRSRATFTFQSLMSFRAWLDRIATNLCLDRLERRPWRVLPSELGPAADPRAAGPQDHPDDRAPRGGGHILRGCERPGQFGGAAGRSWLAEEDAAATPAMEGRVADRQERGDDLDNCDHNVFDAEIGSKDSATTGRRGSQR